MSFGAVILDGPCEQLLDHTTLLGGRQHYLRAAAFVTRAKETKGVKRPCKTCDLLDVVQLQLLGRLDLKRQKLAPGDDAVRCVATGRPTELFQGSLLG